MKKGSKHSLEVNEFLTETSHHLGIKGICRECYNFRRRKRKQLSGL